MNKKLRLAREGFQMALLCYDRALAKAAEGGVNVEDATADEGAGVGDSEGGVAPQRANTQLNLAATITELIGAPDYPDYASVGPRQCACPPFCPQAFRVAASFFLPDPLSLFLFIETINQLCRRCSLM